MRPAVSGRITTDSFERSEPTALASSASAAANTRAVSTGSAWAGGAVPDFAALPPGTAGNVGPAVPRKLV
jgi:hypothetical protein